MYMRIHTYICMFALMRVMYFESVPTLANVIISGCDQVIV